MTSAANIGVSLALQRIAGLVQEELVKASGGKPVAFCLVVQADDAAQYISNCERKDGADLIRSLLDRWDNKRADIPAHYNPDLRG